MMLGEAPPGPPSPFSLPTDDWSVDAFHRSFFEHSPIMMGVVEVVNTDHTTTKKSKKTKKRELSLSGSTSPRDTSTSSSTTAPASGGRGDLINVHGNAAVANFFNRELSAVLGRKSSELSCPQDCIDEWISKCEEAAATQGPVSWDFASPCGRGTLRWLNGVVYPLPHNPTDRKLFCYLLRDITESKELEQRRRDKERRLRYAANVLHHVDGIVWETEAQTGEVTYINTQKTKEVLGKEVDIGRGICSQIAPLLQGTGLSVRDTGFVHTDGDPRAKYEFCFNVEGAPSKRKWLRNVVSEVMNYTTSPPKMMRCGIALDITYEKMNEELAREINDMTLKSKLKSDFFATMSHEIRTPMNGIFGMGELLLDTKLSTEQSEFAEAIINCAHSVLCIVNDILDFSKIEAGKLELYEVPFSLRSVIDETMEILAVKAKEKDIDLHVHYSTKVAHHYIGDAARIRQVVTNLLSNAIKFTHLGSVDIHVELVSTEEGVPAASGAAKGAAPLALTGASRAGKRGPSGGRGGMSSPLATSAAGVRPKGRRGSADTANDGKQKCGSSSDDYIKPVPTISSGGEADADAEAEDAANGEPDPEAIRAAYVSKQRRRNSLPWSSLQHQRMSKANGPSSGNGGSGITPSSNGIKRTGAGNQRRTGLLSSVGSSSNNLTALMGAGGHESCYDGDVDEAEEPAPVHWIKIKVTDTGIGISETRLLSLFKKFEQGDASTAVTFGGSGLGLAISKELVELMGGKMGVASAVGVGSCFHFTLPLRRDTARQPRLGSPIPGASRFLNGPLLHLTTPRVLVADDDRVFCETLRVELEAWGFLVECFHAEEAALSRFLNNCLEPRSAGFRVAFVNSEYEALIAAVRQRRTIVQTQKWASVSLGAVGTAHKQKQKQQLQQQQQRSGGRLKDQFHSLETALQRKDDQLRDTHLVQVSQIKLFNEVNGEGILFKPVRLAKLHKLLKTLLSETDEQTEKELREKQRERRKAKERLKRGTAKSGNKGSHTKRTVATAAATSSPSGSKRDRRHHSASASTSNVSSSSSPSSSSSSSPSKSSALGATTVNTVNGASTSHSSPELERGAGGGTGDNVVVGGGAKTPAGDELSESAMGSNAGHESPMAEVMNAQEMEDDDDDDDADRDEAEEDQEEDDHNNNSSGGSTTEHRPVEALKQVVKGGLLKLARGRRRSLSPSATANGATVAAAAAMAAAESRKEKGDASSSSSDSIDYGYGLSTSPTARAAVQPATALASRVSDKKSPRGRSSSSKKSPRKKEKQASAGRQAITWPEIGLVCHRTRSDSDAASRSPPSPNSPSGSCILSSSSSTVSSCLSMSDAETENEEEECEEDREEKKKKKALILVVDDNMVNQKVICRFLAKIGLENIITAYDGKQAIDVVLERRNEIKLIFMDCRMPILDGYEATRILRQERNVTIPIVAVTANNRNEENEKLCFDSGMNDYVEKPIRFADISLIVSKYILKGKGGSEAYVH